MGGRGEGVRTKWKLAGNNLKKKKEKKKEKKGGGGGGDGMWVGGCLGGHRTGLCYNDSSSSTNCYCGGKGKGQRAEGRSGVRGATSAADSQHATLLGGFHSVSFVWLSTRNGDRWGHVHGVVWRAH